MTFKQWLSAICLFACVVTLAATARTEENKEAAARLSNDLKFLSSDAMEGRGVGTDGLNQAAEFVKTEFEKAGLDVSTFDGSAFQKFTMVTGSELGENNGLKIVSPDGEETELVIERDVTICSFGGSGKLDAELVFCGYAIEDPQTGYNDFDGVDVKGKVAVVMRRVPGQKMTRGPFISQRGRISRHAELRTKVRHAIDNGAAAVIFVNDPHSVKKNSETLIDAATKRVVDAANSLTKTEAGSDGEAEAREKLTSAVEKLKEAQARVKNGGGDQLMPFGYGGNGNDTEIPIAHMSMKSCDALLESSVKNKLSQLESEIDSDLKPRTTVLDGWKLVGNVEVKTIEVGVQNVIGVLEGEGPLADETIVVGAHYDHVGMGGAGSLARGVKAVHNGADDNGSGTVALIELARRLGAREKKLPRRVVFIAFTAEELGLIGSARYVKEPLFPLENTVAMYNMDMVGRLTDNTLTVFGSGTATRFEKQLNALNERDNLLFNLNLKPEGFGPSDHSSFYGKKIPVLHFFTGTHGDYHRPTDDWGLVNFNGISRIVDMVEEIVISTAENPERPKYVAISKPARVSQVGNRPFFGSIPDLASDDDGYAILNVAPASPAEKAGLKKGDRIVKFGEAKVSGLVEFDKALQKSKPGDKVDVVVIRDGKEVTLKVELTKPR